MNCAKTSWPVWVGPSQWADEGGSSMSKLVALGSCCATIGPNTANTTKTATMTSPARTFPLRGIMEEIDMAQAPCLVRGSRNT